MDLFFDNRHFIIPRRSKNVNIGRKIADHREQSRLRRSEDIKAGKGGRKKQRASKDRGLTEYKRSALKICIEIDKKYGGKDVKVLAAQYLMIVVIQIVLFYCREGFVADYVLDTAGILCCGFLVNTESHQHIG